MLEKNKHNRPLSQLHVKRLAHEIAAGRWQYNGDTIKIANNDAVLDGQHRLWAVIEANKAINTLVVNGIEPEAFTTIDTLRKHRTFSDIVGMCGTMRNRNIIATALMWLIRWERGTLPIGNFKAPEARIENTDIDAALRNHPNIVQAVEKTACIRRCGNHGVLACFYYVLCCHDREDLAENMVSILEDPSGTPLTNGFYLLRSYLQGRDRQRLDHRNTFAIAIKAANAVANRKRPEALSWKSQGRHPEAFPVLDIKK